MEALDEHLVAERFDALIIVAEKRALGHLRGVASRCVQQRVEVEIDKDLSGLPDQALRERIANLLAKEPGKAGGISSTP